MAYNDCFSIDLCTGTLAQDIQESCDNPIYSGIAPVGLIVNYDDVQNVVRDAQNSHIIRAITLKEGAKGYYFVQNRNNPFTGTGTAVEVGDFSNTFTATVSGYIPLDGAEPSQKIITPMSTGRYVVFVRNDWEHRDSNGEVDNRWQVYGIDRGLRVSTLQQTRYENNDAWLVELQETGIRRASTFFIPEASCTTVEDATVDSVVAGVSGDDVAVSCTLTVGGVATSIQLAVMTTTGANEGYITEGDYRVNLTWTQADYSDMTAGDPAVQRCVVNDCNELKTSLNIA